MSTRAVTEPRPDDAGAQGVETGLLTGASATYKLASILLQYPTQSLVEGLDILDATAARLPRRARGALLPFLGWLRHTPPEDVAVHYVDTFDLRRRCSLYLTYFRSGDTRNRGMAMLAVKTAYRVAGLSPSEDELPDYLPLVLEFAAISPRGEALLSQHRADLELLRRGLDRAGSPYVAIVDAVCAQLPGLGRRELATVTRAWETGPPEEAVGLEPFAPPEYLSGYPTGQQSPASSRGDETR
ncbi:MAG: nitrate reductase molybdenum cofactor assembly chaperone [Intrasporangium sp.]|uniref:nitrate reductase molybdenum cofactor assembly chaperone n=1 Tax=Intrasporangium sp. TaxID=1925024 RepID=UPI0026479C5B|nr:nitrate reductase molybdenum cofactor assembly chaperone [Intrasporangium sp.]MDN5795543.1 nitrate reductase molybdenum cofactor assembly chaperone [Intrasporangium sp.]